jgi:hypothetical protein
MDHFATATTGPTRQELTESRSAVAAAQGMAEARPDVMRHKGDKTVRVVKKGGKPIGEIGIDAEASPGNGQYYVKLYDGSYDAVGFDSAEEALAELRAAVKQMSEGRLTEFAPSDSGGSDDDDGFDEDTLRKLAAKWYQGDEDPRVEQVLMAAGWEIGQDEGYEDEPGVFVVMSGDEHGKSYMSWPAEELRSEVDEGISNANEDPNLAKAYRLGNEAYKAYKNEPARAQAAQDKIEAEFPQYAKMWLTGYRDGERFDKQSVAESRDPVADLRRLLG